MMTRRAQSQKGLRPFLFALAVLAIIAGPAAAQDYPVPGRVIKIVVPFTPGVGADILARLLGPRIAARWNVPIVTENRVGASGNLGAELVANAPPDGTTLLFAATSFSTNPALLRNLPFDPVSSFAPIGIVATSVLSFLVAPQVPVQTMRDFLALARREPGRLNYASGGLGTPQQLSMELIKLEARIDLVHVPYRGAGNSLPDLMAGHVQAMIAPLQTAAPYVQDGRVRMLAVMSSVRAPAFPDVPTLAEEGLPGLEVETWYGVVAPAGTPARIVNKWNAEINQLLGLPEIRDALARQGMIPAGGSPERMADLIKQELARWTRVVKASGIAAD
jgi:tripartite-type tricarboxylate transporter receptor subunit TctC